MDDTLTLVGTISSIAGFLLGLATTRWGRGLLLDIFRTLRVPFLGTKLVSLGIYDFFDSRKSLSQRRRSTRIFDYLALGKKEIGIIATSLNYSIMHQDLHLDIQRQLRNNTGLEVHIFILDPNCDVLVSVAKATGRTLQDVREYIEQSLHRINEMMQDLSDSERERFHLSLYDVYIANSMLVIDPEEKNGRFLVEHYLYRVPIHGRYSFECKRPGSPMYDKLLASYVEVKRDFPSQQRTAGIQQE